MTSSRFSFSNYINKSRWFSYWHQIDEVLKINPKCLLIIGLGDGVVKDYLGKYIANIDTLDIDPNLQPDIFGSIENLERLISKKYDCILCCQVLEHLPLNKFDICLKEMSLASKKWCIISLPHRNYIFRISLTMFIKTISLEFLFTRRLKSKIYNPEHYWEIGSRNCSLNEIKKNIEKYYTITNQYNVYENGYHRFYVLKRN